MELVAGTRLGAYEIVGPLGAGGMGEVYRARDTRLDRPVAVKLLRAPLAADPVQRERFEREARAVSSLVHPNVCTLFDVGEHEGHRFLVMELLEGETLARRLARRPLDAAEAQRVARELASALAAAHRRAIVHRDVKPANLVLTEHGAKLLDFGLAKGREEPAAGSGEATLAQTSPGVVVGTLAYMSPEQLGGGVVDARTDVYAFGVTLYEACTGRRPPAASGAPGFPPGLPPGLGAIVDRCLQRDPSRRFASGESLHAALLGERAPELPAADAARRPTVGVPDFRNITADPAHDWLAAGIAETLTADLGRLPALAVAGRDRVVHAFGRGGGGEQAALAETARGLGLDLVVTGGYQMLGRAVRITATLVDVASGGVAGSVKVDGPLDDVFRLQDELVAGLARAARAESAPAATAPPAATSGPGVQAFELFARGRQLVQDMGPAGLGEARGLLERAVLLDSGYALARAALGGARAMGYVATGDPADLDAAVAHLARAVELDLRLGEAHAWLCYCRARQGRFAEAAEAGRRAVELDPGGFYGPYFLGAALWMEGSEAFRPGVWREADHALARAASNLPRAPTTFLVLADVRLRCGRYDLAVEAARRGAELEESGRVEGPRILGSHAALGTALLKAGREQEASRVLATSVERLSGLDHVYVPAYLATTRLGEAEIALRQGRADLAYARCREVVETGREGARRLGLGWLAVRGQLGLAVAAHHLLLPGERDAALEEGLGLLRSAAGLGFGTIFQGGPAVAWMDAGRALARLGRDDEAFDAVLQAVEAGWSDPVALETDPALESLRARPEVGHLLAVVAERSRLDA